MRLPRQSTTALCVVAIAVASFGGFGLARYSEGGAFSFYRQQQSVWREITSSQPAPESWAYPVDPHPTALAAEPSKIDAIYASEVERSTPEILDVPTQPYVVDPAPEPAHAAAVVQVTRGSWSQPQITEAQLSEGSAEKAEETTPVAKAPEAASPET